MEADSNMCTCDEGGEGADLLSSLAIAFIVVVESFGAELIWYAGAYCVVVVGSAYVV